GTPWTHCATRTSSRPFGAQERLLGRLGNESTFLARQEGLAHRAHRLQGKLASLMPGESRRPTNPVLAATTRRSVRKSERRSKSVRQPGEDMNPSIEQVEHLPEYTGERIVPDVS